MIEKKWQSLNGVEISLRETILAELNQFPDAEVHIGCDSQQFGKMTEYVTVVAVIRPGKGGRVLYCRERVPRVKELRERLWKEVWRSTELAMDLTNTPDIGGTQISVTAVHVDANVDPKHKSSKYAEELAGLVVGQGFSAILKPNAWAASHGADFAVKHRNERNKPHAENRSRRRAA